jgi:ABC-2 type transport system ATP-binding protein
MIELRGASRWYGQVIGINDVSCTIDKGITALLGQNGAGKSTLIKLVTGQLRPTTGEVTVEGELPFANPSVQARLGYCPEGDTFYEDMSGRQFVSLMARMSGVPKGEVRERTAQAIDLVGMSDRADTRLAGYSKGMRQRIKVAQAIVHDPDTLILDEPLNGLDPVGRRQMGDLLRVFADRGKTVLISSHILHEVEQMTRNILLLHRGRLLAQGDVREIRSLIDRHPHRISITMDSPRTIGPKLLALPSVVSLKYDRANTSQLELETTDPERFYTEFADIVLQDRANVQTLYSPDNNLEAVFKYLVKG